MIVVKPTLPTIRALTIGLLLLGLFTACSNPPQTAESETWASEITLFNWVDDMPSEIFDQFAEEYGVTINLITYESSLEAANRLRSGEVFDVMVIENQFVPGLTADGLLAEINFANVPNFRNISANFRDLAYDPGNAHSIPYNWGTTGLIVRTDLIDTPDSWGDLWQPDLINQVIYFADEQRNVMAVALKTLGYSINTTNPDEVREAVDMLIELGQSAQIANPESYSTASSLVSGEAAVAVGWAYDAIEAQADVDTIAYILPAEGTMLWGDNFVIPKASTNKRTAELFLDFLLRPEIAAELIHYNYYPTPNEAAMPLIDPEILNNPFIFPNDEDLMNAELFLPLSADIQAMWDAEWARYVAALDLDS